MVYICRYEIMDNFTYLEPDPVEYPNVNDRIDVFKKCSEDYVRDSYLSGKSIPDFRVIELEKGPLCSFVAGFGQVSLCLQEEVAPKMHELLMRDCAYARLVSPVRTYILYSSLYSYDAFSYEESKYKVVPPRPGEEHTIIMVVDKFALKGDKIGPAAVFKLKGKGHIEAFSFLSDEFIDLYNELKLTGLYPVKVRRMV